jgi:hypothetical protein
MLYVTLRVHYRDSEEEMKNQWNVEIVVGGKSFYFKVETEAEAKEIQDDMILEERYWLGIQNHWFKASEIQAIGYWELT